MTSPGAKLGMVIRTRYSPGYGNKTGPGMVASRVPEASLASLGAEITVSLAVWSPEVFMTKFTMLFWLGLVIEGVRTVFPVELGLGFPRVKLMMTNIPSSTATTSTNGRIQRLRFGG